MYENKDAASKIISDHLFFTTNFQWHIDLLESEFGRDWKYTGIFIQYSGPSEPVIDPQDFG